MRKYIQSSFLILMMIILTSCNNSNKYGNNQLPLAEGAEGYSIGLYNLDESIEAKRTFLLRDQKFSKKIVLGNMVSKREEFVLVIFDHGKQLPFKVNDKVYTAYRFSANAKEYIPIDITLENLTEKFHSINYIIYRNPDIVADNVSLAFDLSQIFYVRVNLFNDPISQKIMSPSAQNIGSKMKSGRVHGAFLSKSIDSKYEAWFEGEISAEGHIDHTVILGNQEKEKMDFYLVALLDWNQVPYNSIVNLYSELQPGEEITINSRIQTNKTEKILTYLMLPSPFKELPDSNPYPLFSPMTSFKVSLK